MLKSIVQFKLGLENVVKVLIENKADVNRRSRDEDDYSLHVAVENGNSLKKVHRCHNESFESTRKDS